MKYILWFRRDLRLHDHPLLTMLAKQNVEIIPLCIEEEDPKDPYPIGEASALWQRASFEALGERIKEFHGHLTVRRGNPIDVLTKMVKESGAESVAFCRVYEPYLLSRDEDIQKTLEKMGVDVKIEKGNLLFEPWDLKPYKIYTPFWRAALDQLDKKNLTHPTLRVIPFSKKEFPSVKREKMPSWGKGVMEYVTPGELGAKKAFSHFKNKNLQNYPLERDIPEKAATSHLSPHLHFGEITPGEMIASLGNGACASKLIAQLGWREFSYHLLHYNPKMAVEPMKEAFGRFPWRKSASDLKAWQRGETGYPIVDAGMRELWQTGAMHNRVRMIVASFLVKDLLIHWREGEEWFWNTLFDADLANNSASWQWVAGSGSDAAPYFRIFNPTLQGQKFDPNGGYVRKWVPELSKLPNKWIHTPWEAPESELALAGVILGKIYPLPIVDHEEARLRALKYYKGLH